MTAARNQSAHERYEAASQAAQATVAAGLNLNELHARIRPLEGASPTIIARGQAAMQAFEAWKLLGPKARTQRAAEVTERLERMCEILEEELERIQGVSAMLDERLKGIEALKSAELGTAQSELTTWAQGVIISARRGEIRILCHPQQQTAMLVRGSGELPAPPSSRAAAQLLEHEEGRVRVTRQAVMLLPSNIWEIWLELSASAK